MPLGCDRLPIADDGQRARGQDPQLRVLVQTLEHGRIRDRLDAQRRIYNVLASSEHAAGRGIHAGVVCGDSRLPADKMIIGRQPTENKEFPDIFLTLGSQGDSRLLLWLLVTE